jgi:hypothetical protein
MEIHCLSERLSYMQQARRNSRLNNLGDPLKDVHTRMRMVAKTKKDCQ